MTEVTYTSQQIRAANRAAKALKELRDSGLYLIWHSSSGTIYGVPSDMSDIVGSNYADSSKTDGFLECGIIHDGGDW